MTPKDTFRLNMASFKLGDSKLPLESARHPILTLEFLYPVKPNTLATSVRDMDLARLEKQQRETLAVLSKCDEMVAALTTVYPNTVSPFPMIQRVLYHVGTAIHHLTALATFSMHQIITHVPQRCYLC